MFEFLGAAIGGVLGLVGPFIYAQIYARILIAPGQDASGTGALFIVTFITFPAGIVLGAVIGFIIRLFVKNRRGS
jgi:hypothetical protein